ncbi:uncharacterized protein LOC111875065 isoform X2 [Cryptotermes secundus]|nr:uncharacterized protein LOC111875065 isoform X2 [Cryptotermes secundus]
MHQPMNFVCAPPLHPVSSEGNGRCGSFLSLQDSRASRSCGRCGKDRTQVPPPRAALTQHSVRGYQNQISGLPRSLILPGYFIALQRKKCGIHSGGTISLTSRHCEYLDPTMNSCV